MTNLKLFAIYDLSSVYLLADVIGAVNHFHTVSTVPIAMSSSRPTKGCTGDRITTALLHLPNFCYSALSPSIV